MSATSWARRAGIGAAHVAEDGDRQALARISGQEGLVSGRRTAVADLAHALVLRHDQPLGVFVLEAVVEAAAGLELVDQGLPADARIVEVLVPHEKVADRRQQAAVADDVGEGHVREERPVAPPAVRGGPVGDDLGEIVAPLRPGHPQRLEQPLLAERVEAFPRDAGHDDAEQRVPGVAVEEFVAGLEVQLLHPADELQDLVDRVRRLRPVGRPESAIRGHWLLRPLVWLRRWRMRMGFPKSGTSGTYLRTGSSSESLPSWQSRAMAAAVNCLATDPDSKTVSGRSRMPYSRLAMP